jgi:hypothetical protein
MDLPAMFDNILFFYFIGFYSKILCADPISLAGFGELIINMRVNLKIRGDGSNEFNLLNIVDRI